MDTSFARIVVPLDGSEQARTALGPATRLALRAGVPITLITLYDTPAEHGPAEDELMTAAQACPSETVVDIVARPLESGSVGGDIVAEAAADEALICMTTRGRGGVKEAVLGSVAGEVLRRSDDPVLLIGPRFDQQQWTLDGPVAACLDGSTFAESILPAASSLAATLRVPVRLLTVVGPDAYAELERVVPAKFFEDGYLADLAAKQPVETTWEMLHSIDPGDELAVYAQRQRVSVLTLTTHGRTGWRRVVLGSVAMRIVGAAPCPVLALGPAEQKS